MFKLTLHDRNGVELKEGDIVKISNGRDFSFFAEVKWLEKEQVLTPFHTFSFHSFEKVDKVPDNARKGNEERYGIWFMYEDEGREHDEKQEYFDKYLADWRQCEHLLDNKCYRITKYNQ